METEAIPEFDFVQGGYCYATVKMRKMPFSLARAVGLYYYENDTAAKEEGSHVLVVARHPNESAKIIFKLTFEVMQFRLVNDRSVFGQEIKGYAPLGGE